MSNSVGVNTDEALGFGMEEEECIVPAGECGVCFQTYMESGSRKAKSLPCGHMFCTLCLVSSITAGVLPCPTCHAKHKFPLEMPMPMEKEAKKKTSFDEDPLSEASPEVDNLQGKSLEHLHQVQKDLLERKKMHLDHVARLKSFIEQNKEMIELLDQQQKYVKDAQVKGDVTRDKMEKALNKLNGAETDEEIFSVIGEADHCYNNLSNWEQTFEKKQPELDAVIAKAAELAKTHKAAHAIIGQKYLDESAQWLKDKMKSVYGDETDEEEDTNAETEKGQKTHKPALSIIGQKSLDESSQWLQDKIQTLENQEAEAVSAAMRQVQLNSANAGSS